MNGNSRDLKDLDPRLKPLCEEFIRRLNAAGVQAFVTQTYRSVEFQNSLYAQGRTQADLDKAGVKAQAQPDKPKVTNAKGGLSPHNVTKDGQPCARAFDIAIKDPAGGLNWNTSTKAWGLAVVIGQQLGLEPGATFKSIRDWPHFQLPDWKN